MEMRFHDQDKKNQVSVRFLSWLFRIFMNRTKYRLQSDYHFIHFNLSVLQQN